MSKINVTDKQANYYGSRWFKQGLVLHNYIINLYQNLSSTLLLVLKLCLLHSATSKSQKHDIYHT